MFDSLWVNIHAATLRGAGDYGAIRNAALGVKDGKIAWIGAAAGLPRKPEALSEDVRDGGGKWITPGLLDCHARLVYAGDCALGFERRLQGAPDAGGDAAVAEATRAASEERLYDAALARARALFHEGVTGFGINPGPGLDAATEAKTLRVAAALGDDFGFRMRRRQEGARLFPPGGEADVAVLLPGSFYFLRETRMPPVDLFRRHQVPMAVATGHDPGSSPALSLLLMLNMACVLFGLTPEEALAGVTRHAARALGCEDACGTLEAGKAADFALWDIDHPRDLCYYFGRNPCKGVVLAGAWHNFDFGP